MYIIHIVGMVLCVGKEFYVIQILEFFYVEIIIFPIIFGGQTPPNRPGKGFSSTERRFGIIYRGTGCHPCPAFSIHTSPF